MLEKIIQKNTEKSEISEQLKGLREQLTLLETKIKTAGMPVIITFDGWSAAGKGSMIAKLIRSLDPRFYNVVSYRAPNEQEKRMPWLWRYWQSLPKKGEFLILDRSWYRDTVNAFMYGEIDKETRDTRLEDICTFERQLTDDGYVIVKIFLHITEDEQKKRIEKLENSSVTSWRVESHDIKNMEKYDKFFRRYDKMLESTNTAFAPWTCVGANERASAELEMLTAVTKAVSTAVSAKEKSEHYIPEPQFDTCGYNYPEYKTIEMPTLAEVDMNKSLDEAEYEKKLKKYQDKLFKLQNLCYQKKIPVIICYEGWDAAGKGGNIKRIAAALDPRGYEVHPIAAPEPSELARHYLWRFWTRLEKNGHFTIFDRTWYGRVMVEPIEKLTPEERVNMAYREINEFESQLHDWGAEIIKFWVNVDKDEQLRRFNERENTPEKRWKITDEDWRNREKWDTYEKYVDRMITLTSTDIAPWTILEGNDKKYARIKALKTIVKRLEKRLEKEDK